MREASLDELSRLDLPLPPPQFPLVWEPGDQIELRPTAEIEARIAVLHLILARCFGMPPQAAMSWLLTSHLVEMVTPPEWQFVTGSKGDHRSFVLHHDALFALAWVLGLTKQLDPTLPVDERLVERMPDIARGETFAQWRSRILAAPQHPPTRPPCSTCTTASTGRTWSWNGTAAPGPAWSTRTPSASAGGRWSGR